MKRGKVNKPVLHGWIETIHIVHIAILIWLDVWEITFHNSTLFKIWYTRFDWWKLTMALTSWTRLRTEYIRRAREGSERDRERPRTSESQATPCKLIEDSLGSWIPGIGFRISCQWNLDSRFQSLAGFRIPWAEFRIPKPWSWIYKQKNLGLGIAKQYFLDSGIRLTLNEACTVAICNNHRTL